MFLSVRDLTLNPPGSGGGGGGGDSRKVGHCRTRGSSQVSSV